MTFPNGGQRDENRPTRRVAKPLLNAPMGEGVPGTQQGTLFTKEKNMELDKLYGTSPYSPLHTSNRFPD